MSSIKQAVIPNSAFRLRPSEGLRKAAVLVASLEPAAADRLLEQMEPLEARRVRDAILALGPIDPNEQRAIVEEFFRIKPPGPDEQLPGVELDTQLAEKLSLESGPADGANRATPTAGESRPFRFLQQAEDDKLARILASERPQTIALVLAHLSPEQAGAVLVRLAPALQAEVVRRLVDLEETQPEILREVERALESRLAEQVCMQRRRVAGLAAVAAILEASPPRVGMQILDNLATYDQRLADKFSPPRIGFADLERLDDRTLRTILEAADLQEIELALVGAAPALAERILGLLEPADAAAIRPHLAHPGPTRLSDVEEARHRIAELARRLAVARRLTSAHSVDAPSGRSRPANVAA